MDTLKTLLEAVRYFTDIDRPRRGNPRRAGNRRPSTVFEGMESKG